MPPELLTAHSSSECSTARGSDTKKSALAGFCERWMCRTVASPGCYIRP